MQQVEEKRSERQGRGRQAEEQPEEALFRARAIGADCWEVWFGFLFFLQSVKQ